jgi:hypothetical protein
MEAVTLAGLLGLSYVVTKLSNKGSVPKGVVEKGPPSGPAFEGFTSMSTSGQRAPDKDAITQMAKGGSAIGFGPELDMMYQVANGQTYPSEPHPGPYGQPLGYATQQPPLSPYAPPGPQPTPQPIDSNKPMVELRSDGIEENPQYIDSEYVLSPLSGQKILSKDFTHNNMQPFFGGRIKQNIAPAANTSVLDAYNGGGSTQIKKREVENMFETSRAPFGNPFGMEDNTEFFQSRVDAPIARNGERPFEPVHVGSGIGEKFGLTGKGGFQQLEVNEIMRPKDTNDLRVATNPKMTYNQPIVPGSRFVTINADTPGEVRKYRPDKFYIDETGERFFVTTGELIKETTRPVQVLPFTSRPETSVEYEGIATSQDYGQSYVTGSYRLPMSQQYGGAGYRNANMENYYTKAVGNEMADYGRSSIEIRPNERADTSERVIATNAVPADSGLVTQPYLDDARPTRRGETVGNIRLTGTPVRYEGGAPAVTVWDPQDIARTTVKESTIYLDRPGIAGSASAPTRLKVYDPDDIARPTQKSQLSANLAWTGPSMAAAQDSMDPSFAYNMRTNPNKEVIAQGRKPIGGSGKVATFNGNPGRQTSQKLDTDFINDRPMAINRPLGGGGITPGVGDLGRVEYRVPLRLDVSRERNQREVIEAVDNNPLMQSLRKNAEHDDLVLRQYESMLANQSVKAK